MGYFRVATLNIWNSQGPWPRRKELIRAELSAMAVDVLGIQEILQLDVAGQVQNQAKDLADELGLHFVYGPAQELGPGLLFGNGLLSRYPVVESQVFPLPGQAETEEGRSLLYALIDAPFGRVPFFVTHLNWKLHQSNIRIKQVQFIVDRIQELAPVGTTFPPVLVGDFNAEPESDEIRYLHGFATIHGKSVYFADAWLYGGDGSHGYTFDRRNPYAALAHEPPRRIDYIFVRGPDANFRGEPTRTRVVFDAPTEGIFPSDHFGLVTDLWDGKQD